LQDSRPPLDPQPVLKRLPDANRDGAIGSPNSAVFNDSILELLQKHYAPSTSTGKRSRGKKITPGKRITPTDLTETVGQVIGTSSGNTKKYIGKEIAPSTLPQYKYDADMTDVEPDTDEAETSHRDLD
jgi:hypothetical protein